MGILKALKRRLLNALMTMLLLCSTSTAAIDSRDRPEKETKLKAFILYQIPKLVIWDVQIARQAKEFRYCILDDPHFAAVLSATVDGKRHQGRDIIVSLFDESEPIDSCRILYVAHDSAFIRKAHDQVSALFDQLIEQGVLVVGGAGDFLNVGGHIKLETHRNRIGLAISRASLVSDYFKISARLTSIGKVID